MYASLGWLMSCDTTLSCWVFTGSVWFSTWYKNSETLTHSTHKLDKHKHTNTVMPTTILSFGRQVQFDEREEAAAPPRPCVCASLQIPVPAHLLKISFSFSLPRINQPSHRRSQVSDTKDYSAASSSSMTWLGMKIHNSPLQCADTDLCWLKNTTFTSLCADWAGPDRMGIRWGSKIERRSFVLICRHCNVVSNDWRCRYYWMKPKTGKDGADKEGARNTWLDRRSIVDRSTDHLLVSLNSVHRQRLVEAPKSKQKSSFTSLMS